VPAGGSVSGSAGISITGSGVAVAVGCVETDGDLVLARLVAVGSGAITVGVSDATVGAGVAVGSCGVGVSVGVGGHAPISTDLLVLACTAFSVAAGSSTTVSDTV